MRPRARVPAPPVQVRMTWAASLASGLLLIGLGPVPRAPLPDGLVPATVTRYLEEMLPTDARNVRLNNLYGSGHSGAWQFKAHVTWRDGANAIHGGATNLPQLVGAGPVDLEFDETKLEREEQIGWTLDEASALLRRLPGR